MNILGKWQIDQITRLENLKIKQIYVSFKRTTKN
jgi:hypothetical protein